MSAITRVRICLFKPEGFEDTHYVDTENRGLAAFTVMKLYPNELGYLNSVVTDRVNRRNLRPDEKVISVA